MKNICSLRVWHIPQVPMKPFIVDVESVDLAKKILEVLWDYDKFQYENKIKSDYSNASGLETLAEDGTWEDYIDEEGRDIREIMDGD